MSKMYKISIQKRITICMVINIILIILLASSAYLNYKYFLHEYTILVESFNNISSFYNGNSEAFIELRQYFLSRNDEHLKDLHIKLEQCRQNSTYLKNAVQQDKHYWAFVDLTNMLDSLEDAMYSTINFIQDNKTSDAYKQFNEAANITNLIERTQKRYYNIQLVEMQISWERFLIRWQQQQKTNMVIVVLSFSFCMVFALLFTRSITRPINKLVSRVTKISEGDYDIPKIEVKGKDEISVLLSAFNRMAASLKYYVGEMKQKAKLQEQLLEEENENLRMKNFIKETQFQVLQAQIKPHFLFNTLSMISHMAYLEGANQTVDILEATTDLLKYNLN